MERKRLTIGSGEQFNTTVWNNSVYIRKRMYCKLRSLYMRVDPHWPEYMNRLTSLRNETKLDLKTTSIALC